MNEHGRVIAIMPERRGISQKTGEQWASLEFVLEMDGRYTRRVSFHLFGVEAIQKAALQLGEYITVKAEVEAHEFEGRWFNDIRVWDIERNGMSVLRNPSAVQAQQQQNLQMPQQPQQQYQQVPQQQSIPYQQVQPQPQQPYQQMPPQQHNYSEPPF